jgi:hypothetical protein
MPKPVQTMDKAWGRVSAVSILVDADEQEAALATPFHRLVWQDFWLGLPDSSALPRNPFASEASVVLASAIRPVSWSNRTSPNAIAVVLRRLGIGWVNRRS